MVLTIKERIGIIQLLPDEGDFNELALIDEIDKKVNFSREEQKEVGLVIRQDGIPTWKKEKTIEVNFTKQELSLIRDRLQALHDHKRLTKFIFPVCQKFGIPKDKMK